MGQHLENWEIPSVKARMIRQAKRVGEGCERLLFRQTFWFEQVCGQISRDSRVKERKNVRVAVSFLFFFAHQVEVANRRIFAREQFFLIFT